MALARALYSGFGMSGRSSTKAEHPNRQVCPRRKCCITARFVHSLIPDASALLALEPEQAKSGACRACHEHSTECCLNSLSVFLLALHLSSQAETVVVLMAHRLFLLL
jgi:hypothetical protein